MTSETNPGDEAFLKRAVDATIRVGLILLLAGWCFQIVRPFVSPVIWGIIIAVAVYPAFRWLEAQLGGRSRIAAAVFALAGLAALIVPVYLFADSVFDSGRELARQLGGDTFAIPPPPENVASWPLIGQALYDGWLKATVNLGDALKPWVPQLKALGTGLLAAGAGTGLAVLQFIISTVIAAGLLASAESGVRVAHSIAERLAGDEGMRFVGLAGSTVRSVAVGVLGVALIQAMLIGIGLIVGGIPHAGVWSALCLFLAVVQLPPTIVVLPIVIYVLSDGATVGSVVFTLWMILASASDNVLKPILLARGVDVPMLVIFIGSIGGFVSSGFVGLFIGPVVLSVGYELFLAWIEQRTTPAREAA